ncbi:MAG: hypothetical protein K0R03_42 [Moraxellaceae bacterium]|jgi:hypothetical protein|nr:hypothetical protein [Moraxellaceae bacterium]
MRRRQLLTLGLGLPLLAACDPLDRWRRWRVPLSVHQPGLREGHWLRDLRTLPPVSGERSVDTVVIGSGIGGLSAAYKLAREKFSDFLLLQGPEPGGNAAAGQQLGMHFPTGAHYLPVPTPESAHVREILADAGVLHGSPGATTPEYDERALIHAPEDRLLIGGRWQDGLLPRHGIAKNEIAQQERFLNYVGTLKGRRGADGKLLFALPLALSSRDPAWRELDTLSFARWLQREGYTAPSLLWYLDYCCRDDYGAGIATVSAWAGLHYFACRSGSARHAGGDTVLTWPDGLATLARHLERPCRDRVLKGFALHIREHRNGVEVLCADQAGTEARLFRIRARRAVLAMPLHVAARLCPDLAGMGLDRDRDLPPHAPWLIGNFLLHRFPDEKPGADLAWDNVVYRGHGLGYVVSTHQMIRAARPAQTVFTAYQALNRLPPAEMRRWLLQAGPRELLQEAAADIEAAYGETFWRHVDAVHLTLRGHAMAIPAPGFLHNRARDSLRDSTGRLLFAHADLSGLSLFEEASWWGYRAAERVLGS